MRIDRAGLQRIGILKRSYQWPFGRAPRTRPRNREDSMHSLWRSLPLVAALTAGVAGAATAAERRAELVRYGDVQIEVIVEGEGPAVVLLPSLARDSDDYDQVAEGLAAAGFRVLRPKPRGIGRSTGPHDEHHAARSRARHCRGRREARQWTRRHRRPCLRQLGRADDRGRSSEAGARRRHRGGGRQAVRARTDHRGHQRGKPRPFQ